MIQIAICDDEKTFCDSLNKKVSFHMDNLNEKHIINCFSDAASFEQSGERYDIILLDIQMPGLSGMDMAKSLRQEKFNSAIIFITALKEYVFDAFEVEAIDYICKPVDDEKLYKALERALGKIKQSEGKSLLINTANWCKSVRQSSIYYCEVINRKIYLYTQNGVINYYSTIDELEKQLVTSFFRCHRSYIVNLDYLAKYENNQITLENGMQIPVSRLRHQDFMASMLKYMKQKEA